MVMYAMPQLYKETFGELSKKYKIYISSNSPQISIRKYVMDLGIQDFFVEVYGSPSTKEENTELIISNEVVTKDEITIVGDGDSDHRAAKAIGCNFVGVTNDFNKWERNNVSFPLITSLEELEGVLV